MVSLKNRGLKDPKKLILCETHKICVGRNGKKKIDMTKISSRKSAKGLLKKTHSRDKKLKYTECISES
jgi:hypothetical protein